MKVLVTGATGFIGSEIVKELNADGFETISISRKRENEGSDNQFAVMETADISDEQSLKKLETLENVEAIIHSAGLAHQFGDTKKEEFESVNVKGTENIVNLGIKLKIKQFILIGSTAIYGFSNNSESSENSVYHEDSPTNPQTLYAESKLKGETVCRKLCEANNLPLTIFRLAPVIGENNVGNVARLIESIDKGRFLWIGNGKNYKSLIYKNDVAKACLTILTKKNGASEIFNLSAEPVLMKDFVERIAQKLSKRILPVKIPAFFVKTAFGINEKIFKIKKINKLSQTIDKWLADDVYSGEKIFQVYGFKPQTTVLEAVEKQVEYYRRQKN